MTFDEGRCRHRLGPRRSRRDRAACPRRRHESDVRGRQCATGRGGRAIGRRCGHRLRPWTAVAMSDGSARSCSCRASSIRCAFPSSRRAASPMDAASSRRWRSAPPASGWAPASSPRPEARGHDNYKRRITEIDEEGTIITRAHSGKPNRMIQNDFTRAGSGREARHQALPAPAQGDRRAGVLPRSHRRRRDARRAALRPKRGA